MNKNYILVSYKIVNGFTREFKLIEESNCKERLEYLMTCKKYQDLQDNGYILSIFEKVE